MISFNNEIRIQKPVAEVFSFVSDLENIPLWNYFVTRVEKSSPGISGQGATYHQTRKTDSQDLKIVECESNQTLIIETIPPSKPELTRKMEFSSKNGYTRIQDFWELETGNPGLLEKIASRKVRNAVSENLGKLKELLETGSVTLQDGRTIHH